MSDAKKREKVIRGLECCKWSRQTVKPEKNKCDECPYKDKGVMNAFTVWRSCTNVLAKDALALLREQEPRVLTLEDVCGGDECWLEYKYGGHGYADVYLEEPEGTAKVYRCRPVGDRKPETVWLRDYKLKTEYIFTAWNGRRIVKRGTAREVGKFFGMSASAVHEYARRGIRRRKDGVFFERERI